MLLGVLGVLHSGELHLQSLLRACVQVPADRPKALPSPGSTTLYDINHSLGENLCLCHNLWLQCSSVTEYGTMPRDGVVNTT